MDCWFRVLYMPPDAGRWQPSGWRPHRLDVFWAALSLWLSTRGRLKARPTEALWSVTRERRGCLLGARIAARFGLEDRRTVRVRPGRSVHPSQHGANPCGHGVWGIRRDPFASASSSPSGQPCWPSSWRGGRRLVAAGPECHRGPGGHPDLATVPRTALPPRPRSCRTRCRHRRCAAADAGAHRNGATGCNSRSPWRSCGASCG